MDRGHGTRRQGLQDSQRAMKSGGMLRRLVGCGATHLGEKDKAEPFRQSYN